MRQGKLGRWLTLTSFGRVDDQGEQQTIPDWMLPPTAKAALRRMERGAAGMEEEAAGGGEPPTEGARPGGPPAGGARPNKPPTGGIQPDIVVLEGWPETVDPPGCPVTHWTSPEGARRAVRVRIGELACTSDLQSGKTVSRKRAKYEPLISALREAGLNVVVGTVHVVTSQWGSAGGRSR